MWMPLVAETRTVPTGVAMIVYVMVALIWDTVRKKSYKKYIYFFPSNIDFYDIIALLLRVVSCFLFHHVSCFHISSVSSFKKRGAVRYEAGRKTATILLLLLLLLCTPMSGTR